MKNVEVHGYRSSHESDLIFSTDRHDNILETARKETHNTPRQHRLKKAIDAASLSNAAQLFTTGVYIREPA